MRIICSIIFALVVVSSSAKVSVSVVNKIGAQRDNETVEVSWERLSKKKITTVNVVVTADGKEIPSQVIYENEQPVKLIFQASLKPFEKQIFNVDEGTPSDYKALVYGRYVPERKDDYAWENNIVAYRAYGKALEKELITTGVDYWCKRTDELIIDNWYKINDYHTDYGQGCDCYKVGPTFGAGASAPIVDGKLVFGGNYAKWERLENGPLRTTVRLTYDAFDVRGKKVSFIKTVSLDANSRFNLVTESFSGDFDTITVAAGVAIHEGVTESSVRGFVAQVEKASDSKNGTDGDIATAVIMPGMKTSTNKDNLFLLKPVRNGETITYYFGSGWSKAGVADLPEWTKIIDAYLTRIESPLIVKVL